MRDASYRIITVETDWVLEPEAMGTKKKFWFRDPTAGGREWLFKYPQSSTGQHWAEKIATEVARVMRVPHATVELAEFRRTPGSASESFAVDGQELVHGNQILERIVTGYDPTVRFGQSHHSFKNIWECLGRVFQEREAAETTKQQFAAYLVLDAVIGNTDRHHENWGFLRRRDEGRWKGFLAPSFDHASSLGRELRDVRRTLLLEEERVGAYSEKGRGGIYWVEATRYGPSPLDLVRMAAARHSRYFLDTLESVRRLDDDAVLGIVDRVPSGWMSQPAREFAIKLIYYNRNKLSELL